MSLSHSQFQVLTRLYGEHEDNPDNEGISTEDITTHLKGLMEPASIRQILKNFKSSGVVEKVGEIKHVGQVGRPMHLYKITEKGIKVLEPHLQATRDIGARL